MPLESFRQFASALLLAMLGGTLVVLYGAVADVAALRAAISAQQVRIESLEKEAQRTVQNYAEIRSLLLAIDRRLARLEAGRDAREGR